MLQDRPAVLHFRSDGRIIDTALLQTSLITVRGLIPTYFR